MKNFTLIAFCLALSLFLLSCSGSYLTIQPKYSSFDDAKIVDEVQLFYGQTVLHDNNGGAIARNAFEKDIELRYIQVSNHGIESMTLGRDYLITRGGEPIQLLTNEQAYDALRSDNSGTFLAVACTPLLAFTVDEEEDEISEPVPPAVLAIGPFVSIFGFLGQSSSNHSFKRKLKSHNLEGRTIFPGETMRGIICFTARKRGEISMQRMGNY
ncbi:MAG: hypothetical protein AAFY71_15560 [Bacteroidota bacterium]